MKHKWPLTLLRDVLAERREVPSEQDLASGRVRIIEKISYDTGRIKLRVDSSTKTGMILVHPGDLVLSGINAAKGAIAIYDPKAIEPVAATIHYGAYIPDSSRVDVGFLWWMLRSRVFQELLREYVPGGIKTELKAKRLLPVPVPLPPLAEQRRVVMWIEELVAKIHEAKIFRVKSTEETELLIKTALGKLEQELSIDGVLGDILLAPPRNGWSAKCDNAEDGTPVLSLGAVTGFRYRSSKFKRTSLQASPEGHFWLKKNDLLITRSNTPELVGHSAIYSGSPSPCIYPDLMMRLDINEAIVERRFVWYWLQSPSCRDFIAQNAKGTSPTMKKISQSTVMAIPFPTSTPLPEQQQIVAALDALQVEVDALKRLQAETVAELDALLPSVIDRTFKGER
jgi:type I restriction enzyme S subunit